MANIFISYNRKSETVAKSLVNDIELLGHSVWFDKELSGGQAWWSQILAWIRDCDIFVFVLDPEALKSTACQRELGYAEDLGRPILPILISEAVSTNLLPPALSTIQLVDYRKEDRDAALRLARALATVPPAGPLPDPLPGPPDVPISYLGSLAEQVETMATLNYEQQCALLVNLKRGLHDPGTADDTRALLARLRKRADLFATIGEEIDELRAIAQQALSAPRSPAKMEQPPPEQERRGGGMLSKPWIFPLALLLCAVLILSGMAISLMFCEEALSELSLYGIDFIFAEAPLFLYLGILLTVAGSCGLFLVIKAKHRSAKGGETGASDRT